MAARVTVILGPAGSGKTGWVLSRYQKALAEGVPGSTLWLAPTWRAAASLRDRILDHSLRGCFSPGVMTFDQFAEAVLRTASVPMRPLTRLMKRRLVRQLVDDHASEGRLHHFLPIVGTGGLIDLICQWISELKRLEVWPDRFRNACQSRGMTQKDTELLAIYEAYQHLLEENHLYDAEGRFWRARDRLRKSTVRQVERLKLVVADGFTDFTHTQHEILQLLAARVEELLITLPCESKKRPGLICPNGPEGASHKLNLVPFLESDRSDLFFKPLKTLEEFRQRHKSLECHYIDRPESPRWPAMAHLEANLFANPRQVRPARQTDGLEILAVSRQLGEIEQIGRRIKRLLREGCQSSGGRPVPPERIAVVFRSADSAGELVREVFGKLGIPFSLESSQALDRSKALTALVALLRLDIEDWPFRNLLAVIGSNYFQPNWPEWQEGRALRAADRVIRRLQIPRGRKRLIEQLGVCSKKPPLPLGEGRGEGCESPHPNPLPEGEGTCALLSRLDGVFADMPRRATLAQWAKAWERLAEQTGLLRVIEQSPFSPSDAETWRELQKALGQCDTLAKWLAKDADVLDRREALATLLDILSNMPMRGGQDESGRVRVLSAKSVRALEIPYLFFAKLSESAFPPPPGHDRLYSEAESQRLIDAGLPLVDLGQRNREEMLLFYEVVTRATERLWMSYPALDESAVPLAASPYLKEVEQACGPGRILRTESLDLSPVPPDDEPLTAAEFRVKALATALSGNISLLAGLVRREPSPGLAENVLAGLYLTDQRGNREHFGPAEGMLVGTTARNLLAAQYSNRHTFSATELEDYASCPYRFFFDRVLRLKPLEDLVFEVDYLWRGRLVHEALADFHRRVNRSYGEPVSPAALDAEQYDHLVAETLDELFAKQSGNPVEAALREVDHHLLRQWMADYRDQHARYDKFWAKSASAMAPLLFEVSFGHDRHGEPPSTDRALECQTSSGTIRIRGRVDRVDIGSVADRAVFNLVDYKTGKSIKPDREAVLSGRALQLPLYALAVEELMLNDRDALPWQLGYWSVRDNGFKPRKTLQMYQQGDGGLVPTAEWEEIRLELPDTLGAMVRGIRQGEFPVFSQDKLCTGYCPFRTVCRVAQIRSLEKTWEPPRETD